MKILAVNTAGPTVEVALSCGGYFRDENSRNASAVLMPAIDDLLSSAKIAPNDLDSIACVIGPGSFTGIRIGISAVRSICYACKLPTVGINYLQMLAYNERADGCGKILCVSDGSNGTAYVAEFDGNRNELSAVKNIALQDALILAEKHDGAVCVDEKVALFCPKAIVPAADCKPLIRAAIALCASSVDYTQLLPLYVRESQAEKDFSKRKSDA